MPRATMLFDRVFCADSWSACLVTLGPLIFGQPFHRPSSSPLPAPYSPTPLAARRSQISVAVLAAVSIARSSRRILWAVFRCPNLMARLRHGSRQPF